MRLSNLKCGHKQESRRSKRLPFTWGVGRVKLYGPLGYRCQLTNSKECF
ncbi:hypothetical protein HanXRQr2_Chr05g0230481 [Helianthus annuus]|uniref:Uncharacterized protein n=1 Tax=Helianthus annuus TaxID=4232 RepID=A0A9K3J252_HELAN|nr:hypothetical protein HanXRQr2_Chr05g0230481 [Helianthus annuus]KAJ0923925.1 hypothetical protein HanPSC8_Chr05g0222321 [Helianthus annuus]